MNNISFRADYITDISVLKKNKEGIYLPCNVSVVSINRNQKQDYSALKKVCEKWKGNVFCDIIKEYAHPSYNDKTKVLALTTQNKNQSLENCLDYDKIICLASLKLEANKTKIHYLESIPQAVSSEYNHAGTSLIKYLQTKTKKIELFCPSVSIIKQFYYKLGFKHKYPDSKLMTDYGKLYWNKDNSSSFKDKFLHWFKNLFFNVKK